MRDDVDRLMLEERFVELASEWHARVPVPAAPDEDTFRTLRAEAAAIRAAGNWVSGPGDLLSILGRQRDELFHSRLICWLLNPSGRHGLGDRFLRAFLGEVWPGEAIDTGGAVLRVGEGAVLTADAVLSLHDLALANPRKIRVAATRQVRAALPSTIEARERHVDPRDLTVFEGIPTTTVARALLDARGLIMTERLIEAAKEATRRGLLLRREGEQVIAKLQAS